MGFYYRLGQETEKLTQEKWMEVWKAVSLVVEQAAIRRCDLTSNAPETAFEENENLGRTVTSMVTRDESLWQKK
jgi:hypothetical protein